MGQQRLNVLPILSINSDIARTLNLLSKHHLKMCSLENAKEDLNLSAQFE